jgi:hypothetical protein
MDLALELAQKAERAIVLTGQLITFAGRTGARA